MSEMISDTSFQISKRVTETHLHYLNAQGKPMAVYILKAKLKKGRLIMEATSPFDKDTFARQTVTEQMKYAEMPHQKIVAGINADFFNMKNGIPNAMAVKDGAVLHKTKDAKRGFAGVLKNGKLIIGLSALYHQKKNKLEEALGAYPMLVQNGNIIPQKDNSFNHTRHPRTAIGMINKHTVIFVVVDGRQPAYSNGMPLDELALLMQTLHTKTAINLDGGGSSTFVSLNRKTDKWKIRNRPSDGQSRAVANAWVLVQIKN